MSNETVFEKVTISALLYIDTIQVPVPQTKIQLAETTSDLLLPWCPRNKLARPCCSSPINNATHATWSNWFKLFVSVTFVLGFTFPNHSFVFYRYSSSVALFWSSFMMPALCLLLESLSVEFFFIHIGGKTQGALDIFGSAFYGRAILDVERAWSLMRGDGQGDTSSSQKWSGQGEVCIHGLSGQFCRIPWVYQVTRGSLGIFFSLPASLT